MIYLCTLKELNLEIEPGRKKSENSQPIENQDGSPWDKRNGQCSLLTMNVVHVNRL